LGSDAKLGGDGADQILDLDLGVWLSAGHWPSSDEQADSEESVGAAAKIIAHGVIDVCKVWVDVSELPWAASGAVSDLVQAGLWPFGARDAWLFGGGIERIGD